VAADLYFSDRLLGPLISLTAERLEQKESPLLIQVIGAASLAAAVVLVQHIAVVANAPTAATDDNVFLAFDSTLRI
jgi:hypothetical protein